MEPPQRAWVASMLLAVSPQGSGMGMWQGSGPDQMA